MAGDTVTYKIIIDGSGAVGGGGAGGSNGNVAATPTNGNASNSFKIGSGVRTGVALGLKVYDRVVTTVIDRVDITTGQTTAEEKWRFIHSAAKRGAAFAYASVHSLISGNPMGFALGMVGMAFTAADYAIARENLSMQRTLEGMSITRANIRAGASSDRVGRATY